VAFTQRVNVAFQFTSQVLAPSAENACSNLNEVGVISEKMNRTKIARPSSESWPKNSPRRSTNPPNIVARSSSPLLPLAQVMFHCPVRALYKRSVRPSM
jgi:hypothetical protein